MKKLNLVFPNQLFKESPLLNKEGIFCLIEEPLFFSQYSFHIQKIILHRSSMKYYEDFLVALQNQYKYVQAGVFGAMMDVKLINDGPVTLLLQQEAKS